MLISNGHYLFGIQYIYNHMSAPPSTCADNLGSLNIEETGCTLSGECGCQYYFNIGKSAKMSPSSNGGRMSRSYFCYMVGLNDIFEAHDQMFTTWDPRDM